LHDECAHRPSVAAERDREEGQVLVLVEGPVLVLVLYGSIYQEVQRSAPPTDNSDPPQDHDEGTVNVRLVQEINTSTSNTVFGAAAVPARR
jgi:hypothetical protein